MIKVRFRVLLLILFLANTLKAKKNLGIYLLSEASEGVFLYSWEVPQALKAHDDGFVEIMILTPIVWTGLAYLNSTSTQKITGGMVLSSFYGSYMGAIQGALSGNEDTKWRLSLLMSVAENFGNFHLFKALRLNAVTAERWRNFASLGMLHVYLFDNPEGGSPLYSIVSVLESYGSIPIFMKDRHATWGDALFENISTYTLFGSIWLISSGIDDSIFDVNNTYRIASGIISTSVGFGIGYYLSRRYDLPAGAALLTLAIPNTVEFIAMSLEGLMLINGWSNTSPPIIAGGVLLPLATYGTYFLFAEDEGKHRVQSTSRFNIYVNPAAATMALLKNRKGLRLNSIPLVEFNMSF